MKLPKKDANQDNFERSLNLALETIPFGADIVDGEGTILFLNSEMRKLFGNQVGKRCWEIYKDDKSQCNFCPLKSKFELGKTKSIETNNVFGGKSFNITHTSINFAGKNAYLEIFQDITQHREMEKKLTRQLFALESAANATIITDNSGNIKWVNKAFTKITGYSPNEVIGKNPRLLKSGNHDNSFYKNLWDTALSGKVWQGEIINRRKDGSLYVDLMTITPLSEDGQVTDFIAIKQDITERKKMEEALRDREQRLNKTQEIAHLGSWELDLAENRLSWSDEVYRIFGLKPAEFGASYENFLEIVHPDDRKAVDTAYSVSLREGKDSYEIKHRIVRKSDGELRFVHEKCEHVRDKSGKVIRSIGMMQDITDSKKTEEEILMLNEKLKQRAFELDAANRELEAFSYSASHDLRAPLRSIDGFSRILEEEYGKALDEKGKQFLGKLRNATQKMGQLIDDLLNLSKVTRTDMHIEKVDLSRIAMEIAANLKENDSGRKVEFIIADGVTAKCDKNLIKAAMENLLGNAWKFTANHEKARIEFGFVKDKKAYFIRDDGAGFDMEYAGKLFSPFQRLHSSRDFKGTGIGLSIVDRIIKKHGGNIWAEGGVEKGAVFYFTLP